MSPDEPGRPRPGRLSRADYTRRRLLLLAAGLAAAGTSDIAWNALHGGAATGTQRLIAASGPGTAGGQPGPRLLPGSPTTSPSHTAATPTPTPHVSLTPSGRPAHAGKGAPGHRHGGGDKPGHGTGKRRQKVEHVTLPPPTVAIHTQPAYTVHDLLPSAPHRAIALTIDDGPDPEWTPKVLRLLDKYRVQATFCVVGVHVAAYPNLVRDIHRAGHAIVNHSWSHPLPFASLPEKQIVAQITRNQRAIEQAAKVTPELFRAPGGEWSPFVYRALASYGLRPLDWDIDPVDWAVPGTRKIIHRMLQARPDDIVLSHDGGGNRRETVAALRTVLPTWKRRHFDLVTLLLPASDAPVTPSPTPTATPTPSPRLTPPSATPTP
jgi:peptidoglycan/xylan/chitin deacetylase (PgdA/CDA1 family)